MSTNEPFSKSYPHASSVEELRDYFEWLVQNGYGKYSVEMRDRVICLPPSGEPFVDEQLKVAILRGWL